MSYCRKQQGGFTLMELLFTIVVVAVLAALAYPSYLEQLRKSRRADAKSALLACAQMLERFHTQVGHYSAGGDPSVAAACVGTSRHGHYSLPKANVPTSANAPTFVIEAVPAATQAVDACGTFTYTQDGTRGVAGGSLPSSACW